MHEPVLSVSLESAILNGLAAHVAVIDLDGAVIAANTAWNEFWDLNDGTSGYLESCNYLDVCRGVQGDCRSDAQKALRAIEKVFAGESDYEAFLYTCHSPDEERWFQFVATPLDEDRSCAIISHFNLTPEIAPRERLILAGENLAKANRQLEEQIVLCNELASKAEAASRAKSDFLANVSHEIRTPMTAILGCTDIIERDEFSADGELDKSYALQTIRRNADHLLELIANILDLSKIEAGKCDNEQVPTAPLDIVAEVHSCLLPLARKKGIEFCHEVVNPVPKTISSDPLRLKQILLNLVGNAIKFTEVGSVTIRTSLDKAKQELRFEVADTGVGMSFEQCEKLAEFRAFTQADESMSRKYAGAGLGLCIAKAYAKLLGGDLSFSSVQGKGSLFSVTVGAGEVDVAELLQPTSAASPRQVAHAGDAPPAIEQAKKLEGLRILLAEDGPDNQRLISFILRKAGAEVILAENGKIAIELVETSGNAFDVILMDMQMPEMDGYEATRKLREWGFALPVIAITAHAMAEDRQKCLDAGCDDYATKPIDRSTFIDLVARYGHGLQ